MNFERYSINFGVLKDLKLGDESINKSDYLNIKIVNYAPRSFAYLRQLENIDIDEMIESFLPKNNTQGLKKSQGKSGSFFISTDDNQYMIKTLILVNYIYSLLLILRKMYLKDIIKS